LICFARINSKLKLYIVNLAYGKIGDLTEGTIHKSDFQSKSISLNGAFNTLVAIATSFIDPLKYKDQVKFIFGSNEILQKRLIDNNIKFDEIKGAGHGAFKTKYKEIVKLIIDNDV
jgi:hypothetical protein